MSPESYDSPSLHFSSLDEVSALESISVRAFRFLSEVLIASFTMVNRVSFDSNCVEFVLTKWNSTRKVKIIQS